MFKEEAINEAMYLAREDGIPMVVTYNPYDDNPEEAARYWFYPACAKSLFPHERVVVRIDTQGEREN